MHPSVVRGRLAPDYAEINRQTWGCPIAIRRVGWSDNVWPSYWWWNVGWGGACDVNGISLSTPSACPGGANPPCGLLTSWADGFKARIDGTGYSGRRSPEDIVLITDSGGLPTSWTAGITAANHHPPDNPTGKPMFSQSLTLSGLALRRPTEKLNSTWNGGANTWR